MKRIYFLVPNIEITRKVVNDLLLARIDERHLHVLANGARLSKIYLKHQSYKRRI